MGQSRDKMWQQRMFKKEIALLYFFPCMKIFLRIKPRKEEIPLMIALIGADFSIFM